MRLMIWILSWFGAILARVEYFFHILRFHKTEMVYCVDGEPCVGHYVCHTCSRIFWDRYFDPWRNLRQDEDDDAG